MPLSKEENIQEAIRLVQECNYSRRKAAGSTGISPNTLKRRLNGSIPREEYLERTKKITASEELILENMIIALIQQGEHVKASALRVLVALYIKNKTAPTKSSSASDSDLELIPKGWCARFMKRSKNLVVNQGLIEIKDKQSVQDQQNPPVAFEMFLKPPQSDTESLAETQKQIVSNSSTLIQGFRMDFDRIYHTCTNASDKADLLDSIHSMATIFHSVSTLASVLNLTSHVNYHQLVPKDQAVFLTETTSSVQNNASSTPHNSSIHCTNSSICIRTTLGSTDQNPLKTDKYTNINSNGSSNEPRTPSLFGSTTPGTPPSPTTPSSPSSQAQKRRISEVDDNQIQDHQIKMQRQQHDSQAGNWEGSAFPLIDSLIPTTTPPLVNMLMAHSQHEIETEKKDYFNHQPSCFNSMLIGSGIVPGVTTFASREIPPSLATSVSMPELSAEDYSLEYPSSEILTVPSCAPFDGMIPSTVSAPTISCDGDLNMMLSSGSGSLNDTILPYN